MQRQQQLPIYLWCLLWLLAWPAAQAAPVLVLDTTGDRIGAGLHLRYFHDAGQRCDFACARARFAKGDVTTSTVETPNLGMTDSWWFQVDVQNSTDARSWVVRLEKPYLDRIDLHVLRNQGQVDLQRTGDAMPTRERPILARLLALPFTLEPGEKASLYLRVQNRGPVTVPLSLETRAHFDEAGARDNLAWGFYFGILVCVLLYNTLIYAIMRDASHILYSLYAACFALLMATVAGFSALFFWPDHPWLINRAVPILVLLTGASVILFTRSFLQLSAGDIRSRLMVGILWTQAGLMPAALFAPFSIAVHVIYLFGVVVVIWLLWLGVDQVLRGNRSARYFMLAWVALLVMLVMYLLVRLGVLPSNAITENGILFGSAAEAILLSIALAHRFALIRDENERLQVEAAAELERRVQERTRELDSALQARSEFLATMSHEIRTPMNGVLGIAELLEDSGLDARQRELVRIIQGSGKTLLTVINDILDFSKIEAGRLALESRPFRIGDVLSAATQIFRAEAERKHLRFVTVIDDEVPEQIIGDSVRLQQVLNNLLSNALKFTEHGEISLNVHREADGRLTFTVRDTGSGIPASIQPRLFEAFSQGDGSTSRRYGGTGLGLAISRRLIELMGGSISFESDVGHGSTFYFTIPARTPDDSDWQATAASPGATVAPLRLLVVDDNDINLMVASGMLQKLGHVVETATDGRQAIERIFAAGAGYDAVLMDCEMPGLDGFTATRRIRERESREARPRLPVIALTAHALPEKIAACRAAGMDAHVAKPLTLRSLEEALARLAADT